MRITERQRGVLRKLVAEHFGQGAELRLFGSRVDDAARGGDFDLFVVTRLDDPARIVDRRLRLLAALHATPEFEDERIDLVLLTPLHRGELPIHRAAREQGVRL
jgi:predicted nucleotidyltransferase